MIDLLGQVCFWGALILPPIVFGVTVYKLRQVRRDRLLSRLILALLFGAGTFVVLMIMAFGIALRNGLES